SRRWRVSMPPRPRPSLPIATGTTSYRAGSSARITCHAERSDTSCSPDRPPKSTPTRTRRVIAHRLLSEPCGRSRLLAPASRLYKPRRRPPKKSGVRYLFCLTAPATFCRRAPLSKPIASSGEALPPPRMSATAPAVRVYPCGGERESARRERRGDDPRGALSPGVHSEARRGCCGRGPGARWERSRWGRLAQRSGRGDALLLGPGSLPQHRSPGESQRVDRLAVGELDGVAVGIAYQAEVADHGATIGGVELEHAFATRSLCDRVDLGA